MQVNKSSLSNLNKANTETKECVHCLRHVTLGNINKHVRACRSNPSNQKDCPVCKKMHSKKSVTCSYSCSNTYFRTGTDNGNWKDESYQSTCFHYHGKKCLACDEKKIVAAHHVNEDKKDNRPENLVPLCPTHHQYVHSRYRDEIQPIIDEYLKTFLRVA